MKINIHGRGFKFFAMIGLVTLGWFGHVTKENLETPPLTKETPKAQHAIHFAQLGVPDAESFSSLNALYDKFSRDGDHLEYPLTMLCGCSETYFTQWGIASESQTDLEGKIFQVKHTPITFWNKRLWFIGDEVDPEGKPLPKPLMPGM